MKAFIRITLFCLLSILMQQSAIAQQYPITASTQIIPPYSVYLPDYAVPGSDKLRVILVQNDLTQPSYEVRLRMTVEMNGAVIMRTSQAFTPKPLALSPGVPTIISGADLYDYLNSNNIDFSGGFSRETYDRTKALPEGAYRISFTAYDYRRSEVQISNIGANVFFFQKSEPPVLNQPVCDSRVVKMDPQFLTFNWSSRNTPNPLEGSGTEYVFSLYEIKPKGSNPDYIIRSAKPLYTTITESNTLIYGPGEPQLIDSMDYVWVVQARDKSGRDMYSNQGLSKSCKFSYLSNNPFAANNIGKPKLNGEATGERSAKLWWPLAAGGSMYSVEAYRVQYRAATKDGVEFDWFTEEKENDTTLALYNLEPSRAYEARLQWRVAGVYGPYSDLVTITTDALRSFTCGESPQVQGTQNTNPLPVAVAGMPVKIGHFYVLLTDVSGSNGVFSGKGRIITPGFGMGLLMEFKGITINTDLVVIRGEMQAVTSGIDKFVDNAVKEQRGGADVGKVKTGDIVPDITTNLHIFSKDNIVVNTDAGTITVKDSNTGKEEVINYKDKGKTLPLVLEDADGNMYNIDKNGKVTAAGTRDKNLAGNASALSALNTLKLDSGVVNFTAVANSRYAFDSWKSSYEGKAVLDSSYEKLANGKYRVSAKALVPGEQEDVLATLSNAGSINTDKIKFVSGKGIVYPSKKNGNTWTITLTGGPAGDAQEVFAVYPKSDGQYISMGKLLVASYAPLQNKIVLIPIGATTQVPEDAIRNSLDKAYAKVGVTYTITTDNSFQRNTDWDDNKDSLLQDTRSAFLSNGFTGEEKALKNAYKKSHSIDDNTTYLFLVNEAALKDGDLLGKMPRQSQFGFIFMKNASAEDVGRTVAHETGHGAYTLEHTFSKGIDLSANTTDNLMDYTKGYDLLKYQWDVVHSPGHVWGIFEGDDASASVGYSDIKVFSKLKNETNDTYTFITPSGKYITLPSTASNLKFSTLDRTFEVIKGVADLSKPTETLIPLGALLSFTDQQIAYNVRNEGASFEGYMKSDGKYYIDPYSKQLKPESGIAVVLGIESKKFVSYAARFKSTGSDLSITDDYTGKGTKLDKLAVVDLTATTNPSTLLDVLNQRKVKDLITLPLPATDLRFTNDKINFKYNLNSNVSLNDFLLAVLSEKSSIEDYLTYFTLANLKENELQAFSSCLSDANQLDLNKLSAGMAMVSELLREGKAISSNRAFELTKLKTLEQLIALANVDIAWLKKLKQAVADKKSADDINAIFVEKYYQCSLAALNITERIYLLNQLLSEDANNNYWYTDPSLFSSNDGHFIVKDLISTTPAFDQVELLKKGFMDKNYQWMQTLWIQANKWMNGVGYDEVHNIFDIINPWISSNYTALEIKPTKRDFSFSMFGISAVPYYPGESDYVIGMKNEETYVLGNNYEYVTNAYSRTSDIDFKDDGKIYFKQNYTLSDVRPIYYETGKRPDRTSNIYYDENYSPFEPVTMLVADNYHEDGLNAGDRFIIPAYMAMVYDNDVRRTNTGRTVRTAANVVTIAAAILAAPETGGSSLALITTITARVAGAVALADLEIQKERGKLSVEAYAQNKGFYEAWDKVKTVTDYASLSVGGANMLKWGWTKFGSLQKISNTVNEVTTTMRSVPAALSGLKNGWSRLENLNKVVTAPTIPISESKLFTGSKLIVDNFDELVAGGKIAGYDDVYLKGIFNLGKNSGGSGYDDFLELTTTPVILPKLSPGGTSSDLAVLTKPASVTAIKEMVAANQLKQVGEEISIFTKASSDGTSFIPITYTKGATAIKYASAEATSVAPEVIVVTVPGEAPQLVYSTAKVAEKIIEKVKEKNQCKRCDRFTQDICKKFETLQASVGTTYTAAVTKLCANLPFDDVSADLDYLLALDKEDKASLYKFLDDITATSDKSAHISNKVNVIDVKALEAWRLMKDAKGAISANYQVDFEALKQVKIVRASATFNTNVGNDAGLKALLTANKGLRCFTCENKNKFVQFADDYIKDFKYFSDNYNSSSNASKMWNELKQPKALKMVYGAAFQIRVLRQYSERFRGGTVSFDDTIDDDDTDNPGDDDQDNEEVRSKCRYDIKLTLSGVDSKFFEFKSWGKSTVSDFKNNPSKRVYFAKQLRTYLDKVNNLENLDYIFDGRRMTIKESKEILQKVLIDNADAWFGTGGFFGPSKLALFGYDNVADFKTGLNDLNSNIYLFVNAL